MISFLAFILICKNKGSSLIRGPPLSGLGGGGGLPPLHHLHHNNHSSNGMIFDEIPSSNGVGNHLVDQMCTIRHQADQMVDSGPPSILTVLDHRNHSMYQQHRISKESSLNEMNLEMNHQHLMQQQQTSGSNCTPSKLYFPSPYAMNQLELSFKHQPNGQHPESCLNGAENNGSSSCQNFNERQQQQQPDNQQHQYDVPFPPKWV